MTQQVIHARTTLTALDPNTDNPSISTYWEQIGTNTNVNLATVKSKIVAFFNTVATGATNPMSYYLSNVISRSSNQASIEYYDITGHLNGTPAGSPIGIDDFTVAGTAESGSYPDAVAATLGYRVDYGTDVEFGTGTRPRSRDRNRFYLGPLNPAAFTTESVTFRCVFAPQFITDLLAQAAALLGDISGGPADITAPVVWTRVGAAVKQPIIDAWTDDRPDYQRRRSDPGIKRSISVF